MNCRFTAASAKRTAAVLLIGVGHLFGAGIVRAQPLPLPYQAEAPFLPGIDLFGSPEKGLIFSAEEAIQGRPAPITIGNTTFVPAVTSGGQPYGGYTSVEGDLQIINGDIYMNGQRVGVTLEQLQRASADQQLQLQQQDGSIRSMAANAAQAAQTTASLGSSVNELSQASANQAAALQQQSTSLQQQSAALQQQSTTLQQQAGTLQQHAGILQQQAGTLQQQAGTLQQHAGTLQQHDAMIGGLATEVGRSRQAIATLDQNLSNLGSGVAGSTALAAALTSLPAESQDTPVACGVGTGGYSSRYALALGCALRLHPALSINGGGSYLFGGVSNYGSGVLSNIAGRLGLVYRFGSGSTGKSPGQTVSQAALSRQLQQQLQQTQQRSEQMAAELREVRQRLAQLESVALLR